jgi:hypothetical protein
MAEVLSKAQEAATEARAEVDTAVATLMAHEAAVRRDSAQDALPRYVPVSERALCPLTRVTYASVAKTTQPKPEEPQAPPSDAQGKLTATAATCRAKVEALAAERDGYLTEARKHLDAAEAAEHELQGVEGSIDLPEVRVQMARRGELDARIQARREEIGAIKLDTPTGREDAQRAAEEVLKLRAQVPAIDAELTRLRSRAYVANWRKRQQGLIAKERAAAHVQSQKAAEIAVRVMHEQSRGLRVEGALGDLSLQVHISKITALAKGLESYPSLGTIVVERPGEAGQEQVLEVARPAVASVFEALASAQAARAALALAVTTLATAWEASASASKQAAALQEDLSGPRQESALAAAWKGTIKRLALKGAKGTAGRVLRRAFASLPTGAVDEPARAKNVVPLGDLALALERFEASLGSNATQKLLRKVLTRELRRGKEALEDEDAAIEAAMVELTARARRPFMQLARESYGWARAEAERAGAAGRMIYEGIDPESSGTVTPGVSLRVGDPVTVILAFQGKRRDACPQVRVGPHTIPAAGRAKRMVCLYQLDRLDSLPDKAATLHIGPGA